MSAPRRKLGFYSLTFKKSRKEGFYFDPSFFQEFIDYVKALDPKDGIIRNETNKTTIGLDSSSFYQAQNHVFGKLIFKSCKYNHSPDYMSSVDGAERESEKGLDEGEKEKTHLLGRFHADELTCVLEERKSGVSIKGIVKYLNIQLREYLRIKGISPKFSIIFGVVSVDDFVESLNNLRRVCAADLYIHKELIGAEGLALTDRDDPSMKDEIVLGCTVKKGESLGRRMFTQLFHSINSEGERVKRIRIYGKNQDGVNILLDTDIIKRVEHVEAELDAKGVVDSHALFAKMEEIFGVDE